MARPMHTPESATAAAIARRWAAPWKATMELALANHAASDARRIELEFSRIRHESAYRAALSAGIPPRVIARRDLDDPRLSDMARQQAIVNALGARGRPRRTISTFPHDSHKGDK